MIDLHSHSTASDGTYSPRELLQLAADMHITALALTDHDTLDGLKEAQRSAENHGIRFLPGIELEINHYPGEFHLLGINIKDWEGSKLDYFLKEIRMNRNARNTEMIELIQADGIDITQDDLDQAAGGRIIARPHFAKVLVQKKKAKTIKHAFDQYLAVGQKFYLPKKVLDLVDGIDLIHKAGGKAIIAHPLSLYLSWGKLPGRLMEWKDMGIDGIEALHSGANKNQAQRFTKLAEELGLIITGGSDFHGTNRKDRSLGRGAGHQIIPESILDALF